VSLHRRPRSTKDVDSYIDGGDNILRIAQALQRFGAPPTVVRAAMSLGDDEFVFMGKPPLRVDLTRDIKGLPSFDEAYRRSVCLRWGTRTVRVVALDDLLTANRAAGRAVDRRDVGPDGQRKRSSAAPRADALRDRSARPDVISSERRNRVLTAASNHPDVVLDMG